MEKTKNKNGNYLKLSNLLWELKSIIEKGKQQSYKTIDNILVETLWQIGEELVERLKYRNRADYGNYLIKIWRIFKYHKTKIIKLLGFIGVINCPHTVRTIELRHYVLNAILMKNVNFMNKKLFNSWSVRELARQIKDRLYQKTSEKRIDEISKTKLPAVIDLQKIFKPDYDLIFRNSA